MFRRLKILTVLTPLLAVAVMAGSPHRVVSLGPSLTETVFALGCGDRLVGVGDYAQWPPEVRKLPRVGGLYNPSLERLLALRPGLVLIPSPMPRLETACRRADISVETVRVESLHGVLRSVVRVAELLGCPRKGYDLAAAISRELDRVRSRTAGLPRPRVLLQVGAAPGPGVQGLTVAGGGTFLSELVETAGAVNVFGGRKLRYFRPSLENVLRLRPGVVLIFDASAADPAAAGLSARAAWPALLPPPATPEVHVLTDQLFVLPGPRVGQAAARLARLLHPETAAP